MEIIARPLLEAHDFSIYSNKVIFRQSGRNQREQKTRVLKDSSMSGVGGGFGVVCLVPWVGSDLSWHEFRCSCSSVTLPTVCLREEMGDEQGTSSIFLLSESKNETLFKSEYVRIYFFALTGEILFPKLHITFNKEIHRGALVP